MMDQDKFEKIVVDAQALREVLVALNGAPHLIAELQATRSLGPLTGGNPIETLLEQFNAQVESWNAPESSYTALIAQKSGLIAGECFDGVQGTTEGGPALAAPAEEQRESRGRDGLTDEIRKHRHEAYAEGYDDGKSYVLNACPGKKTSPDAEGETDRDAKLGSPADVLAPGLSLYGNQRCADQLGDGPGIARIQAGNRAGDRPVTFFPRQGTHSSRDTSFAGAHAPLP